MTTIAHPPRTSRQRNPSASSPPHVCGVDFSGAMDAGRRIWLARGSMENDVLRIWSLTRGDRIQGSGASLFKCLKALRNLIAESGNSLFGLDFCFSLPLGLMEATNWYDFISTFPERFSDPRAFRTACRKASPGSELKRRTDLEKRTPFSPYNLRIYRQTYYGIREVLHPLVTAGRAAALPMQKAVPGKPRLVEVCPASLLKARSLYTRYKGKTAGHRGERERIVHTLEERNQLSLASAEHRNRLLDNATGDALDSVLAAVSTARALCDTAIDETSGTAVYAMEGYVYI